MGAAYLQIAPQVGFNLPLPTCQLVNVDLSVFVCVCGRTYPLINDLTISVSLVSCIRLRRVTRE